MAYNVLQKTAGLKTVPFYVPDTPGYSNNSSPFPKNDNYSLPPISYDPATGGYIANGKYFDTYESLNGYIASSLWVQQGGIGYGYEEGFVVIGIEQAKNSDFINFTVELTQAGVNPYLAATQNGQVVTNLGAVIASSPVINLSKNTYTGVRPVSYGAPPAVYSPPAGSGIDMSGTGGKLTSYVNTQFDRSSLFTF